VRVFGIVETAKINNTIIHANLGAPALLSFIPSYAFEWVGAPLAYIAHVLAPTGRTKIAPAIIGGNTIDMVHLGRRPLASHPEIDQAGRSIRLITSSNDSITVAVDSTSDMTDADSLAAPNPPSKNASFGVVVEKFTQPFWGDTFVLSHHSAPNSSCWLGVAGDAHRPQHRQEDIN